MKRFLYVLFIIVAVSVSFAQNTTIRHFTTREDSIGAMNAVKKAHQMTDLPIHPVSNFYADKYKTYKAGVEEKGVTYSSTKEINTSVGQDVSFHTYMTALHNPRSFLYSERIDLPPYHGVNCRGYYGTVCSGLVTYALGFKITQRSADFPDADYMELVGNQSAEGAQIADVIWTKKHVQLLTGIERGADGKIKRIEICESVHKGCRRVYMDEDSFNQMLHNKEKLTKLYRYKYLPNNISYTPCNDFVAVDGEKKLPFVYNDEICANKGDKCCYVVGEDVVLNVFTKGDKVEIYKDSKLYREIEIHKKDTDIVLKGYPYGDYQARIISERTKSEFTKWKIIDVHVKIDREKNQIYFSSANAIPIYYEFCNISGIRPTNKNRIYAAEFTETDLKKGHVTVKAPKQPTREKPGFPFVKIHFACDYGMVINKPINWYD